MNGSAKKKYKFILSPPGAGFDCHRTWEALYLGAIPIVKTSSLDPLYKDLPVVIELVDTEENLSKLMPFLDKAVTEGLITSEKVRVLKYRHKDA